MKEQIQSRPKILDELVFYQVSQQRAGELSLTTASSGWAEAATLSRGLEEQVQLFHGIRKCTTRKGWRHKAWRPNTLIPKAFSLGSYSWPGIRFCFRLMGRHIDNRAGTANLTTWFQPLGWKGFKKLHRNSIKLRESEDLTLILVMWVWERPFLSREFNFPTSKHRGSTRCFWRSWSVVGSTSGRSPASALNSWYCIRKANEAGALALTGPSQVHCAWGSPSQRWERREW